jgi:hypothetical protein
MRQKISQSSPKIFNCGIGYRLAKAQRIKARAQKVINDVLQNFPESFDDDSWENAGDKIYMHVFDRYHGAAGNTQH